MHEILAVYKETCVLHTSNTLLECAETTATDQSYTLYRSVTRDIRYIMRNKQTSHLLYHIFHNRDTGRSDTLLNSTAIGWYSSRNVQESEKDP